MDSKQHVQILLGSTRNGRQGEKVAKWIYEVGKKRDDMTVELLDLKDYPLPYYEELLPPAALGGNYTNEVAKKWANKIGEGDAYVIVSPEYNHGYPAALKNALDYVYTEWNNKPMGLVTYSGGPIAGVRAAQQLRQVAIELQMAPIRNGIHLPFVQDAFDENGQPKEDRFPKLAVTFFDQLLWWGKALKEARQG